MSPPKEDDRKLPMKKGFEEAHPYIALPPLTVAVDAGLPRNTPVSTGFLPYSDRCNVFHDAQSLKTVGTCSSEAE